MTDTIGFVLNHTPSRQGGPKFDQGGHIVLARDGVGRFAIDDGWFHLRRYDPRDRVDIQRWTELLLPPEIIGAHVGSSLAHATGRATDLSYRAAVSLMVCSGFE